MDDSARQLRNATVMLLACSAFARAGDGDATLRFSGNENDRTPEFERSGPWMLDWSTSSDNTLPKIFELRLYRDGAFAGRITEARETGSGRKLFDESGSYRIEIVARHLDWSLRISGVERDEASRLKRRSDGRSTLEDTSRDYARRVREDDFEFWRPVDDLTLLLYDADKSHGFRISFAEPCKGLNEATALLFVAAGFGSGGEVYEAIMLDDGTHCPFERVVPTVF